MKFDIETIDSIMLDIEGLGLPVEKHHPVLMLVLGAIEHYAPAPATVFSGLQPIENLPEFLKKQAARDVESVSDEEPPAPAPRTSVAPQAAFSPAPVPEAVRVEPRPTTVSPGMGGLTTGAWSLIDEQFLVQERNKGVPFKAIAGQLNRSISAVNAKHKILMAPQKPLAARQWTEEQEENLLVGHLEDVPMGELAEKIGRTEVACKAKLKYISTYTPEKMAEAKKLLAFRLGKAKKPASKTVGEIVPAPAEAPASKAEGGAGFLPRPCPDEHWPIEDDLDLVSEHHRGLSMMDVSIILERTKPDCVARYKALIEAMPESSRILRQAQLKKTLAYHAAQARKAA